MSTAVAKRRATLAAKKAATKPDGAPDRGPDDAATPQ